jgi:hypothetical protein
MTRPFDVPARAASTRVSGVVAPLLIGLSLASSACGTSAMGPGSVAAFTVSGISPNTGTTIGGTSVTITGSNFSADASVSIGGVLATRVVFVGATTLTATTGGHAAGAVDVVVTSGGQSSSIAKAFTYVAPVQITNQPPAIVAISVAGSKPREPGQFADLDESVNVSATVTDAETPVSQLTFVWSADAGTFSGSGTNVVWTAPTQFGTPGTATLTLTVVERYQTTDDTGLPVTRENTTVRTTTVRVHNSAKEVSDLASDFLTAFSQQLDPAYVVRNFSTNCTGSANELSDVQRDEQIDVITAYTIGAPVTTVGFTGRCPFRGVFGDACAQVPASWTSVVKVAGAWGAVGDSGTVTGTDQVTAVLENDQWRLCASDWAEASSTWPNGEQGFRRWKRN